MDSSVIEEIKNRLDITEVVGSYLTLQKVGANFRANCPFHSEKSPSFFVSPTRQMWHCFGGCQTGGDVFKFIMEIEGIEFREALEMLAQRAGVELPKWSPQDSKLQSERKRLYDLQELAAQFFQKQLESETGKKVVSYLRERGLSGKSIQEWRLGYAPEGRRVLSDFLLQKGYTQEEINRAGLSIRSEQGVSDRFRGRIIFPISDLASSVIGFGGRAFGQSSDKIAKYVNTSSTPLYDKSRVVYGLDRAKVGIRKADSCILVEGYTDVILMFQAGYENTVASSGTALTSLQLKILKRYTRELTTAFDMDFAGDKATKRGIELAVADGFNVKVMVMPQGKDPADMVKEAPEKLANLIKEAGSVMDFYLSSSLVKFDKTTAEGKRKIGEEVLPVVKKIPSRIEQAHWIKKLASELDVTEQVIAEELDNISSPVALRRETLKAGVPERVQKSRHELLEEQVVVLLFQNPSILGDITSEHLEYFSKDTQEMLSSLRKIPSLELAELQGVVNLEAFEQLKYLSLRAEVEETDEDGELGACLQELKFLYIKEKLDNLAKEIRKAEEGKDAIRLDTLMEEFHKISQQLNTQ